jgi:hypothetical protein
MECRYPKLMVLQTRGSGDERFRRGRFCLGIAGVGPMEVLEPKALDAVWCVGT